MITFSVEPHLLLQTKLFDNVATRKKYAMTLTEPMTLTGASKYAAVLMISAILRHPTWALDSPSLKYHSLYLAWLCYSGLPYDPMINRRVDYQFLIMFPIYISDGLLVFAPDENLTVGQCESGVLMLPVILRAFSTNYALSNIHANILDCQRPKYFIDTFPRRQRS